MASLAFVQAFLESFKGFLSQATLISVLIASVLILFLRDFAPFGFAFEKPLS